MSNEDRQRLAQIRGHVEVLLEHMRAENPKAATPASPNGLEGYIKWLATSVQTLIEVLEKNAGS
jgi:hypothetical protein